MSPNTTGILNKLALTLSLYLALQRAVRTLSTNATFPFLRDSKNCANADLIAVILNWGIKG